MSHTVHVVVLSDRPKFLGTDVEVCVRRPAGDPWTFPFAHKHILAERIQDYDLFIYSEDDTLISERNIAAFLEATDVLHDDEIAGFLRSELDADGKVRCSTIHSYFHWEPKSVVQRGDSLFAFLTNEHSASYMLTRKQLQKAIKSGGFLVEPHQGRYDLLVTAATDPYTQCGLRKMINVSRVWDFTLAHLPNKYVGRFGITADDLEHQVSAIKEIAEQVRPRTVLFNNETRLAGGKWSKSLYEPPRQDIEAKLPLKARNVLSYGCGWGEFEAGLVRKGISVIAIPVDSVIGACAETRGVRVLYGDSDRSLSQISGDRFDCILMLGVLHLLPAPEHVLSQLAGLLEPGGLLVASVPNMLRARELWYQFVRQGTVKVLGKYEETGAHFSCSTAVQRWFKKSSLSVRSIDPLASVNGTHAKGNWAGILGNLIAPELLIVGEKVLAV